MKVHGTFGSKPGLQEAFWLWPDDRVASNVPWPAAGEIDVAELYSQYNYYVVPFLHYTANDNGGPKPGVNTAYCSAARGKFITYTLTWTPSTLTIQVDGKTCVVNITGDPAFQKPYIVAFTAALGVGSNALTWNTPIPATMSVDYLRIWR
jgi:beta-glucanase (GH16 family)